ncbi:MAG TPA: thioredoxin domain-containing protein [Kofleriaceae bacterium]|nr:thioredoxin domain-containing protein [Kofleriaceae bacterium]
MAVLAALGVACAANNQNLEVKVENFTAQLAKMQREVDEVHRQLAVVTATSKPAAEDSLIEQKLDELARKIDLLAARDPSGRQPRLEPDRSQVYAIPVDGHPSKGPKDAKVTMVVVRDYACPYCEKSRATLDELHKKYGGDLRLVYRNMIVHPQVATAAAIASCAAAKQGKFEALDDALWEQGFKARQFDTPKGAAGCWTTSEGCPIVLGFARDANLDLVRFKAEMRGCEAEIQADMAELMRFAVGATPSFFINGRFMSGAMPLEDFAALIDEERAKANERIKAGTPRASYYKTWILGKGLTKVERPTAAAPSAN